MKIYKIFYLNKDKEENNYYYKLSFPKELKDEDKENIDELAYSNENIEEEEEKIDSLLSSNEGKEEVEEYEEEEGIFLEDFVEKNKYKYKIIYKNKIYSFQSIFDIIGIQVETAKFKLICYNHTLDNNEIPEEFPFYQNLKFDALKLHKKNMNMNIDKYIDYHLYSSNEILKLIYKINSSNKIRIFGEEFVANNGKKCAIIYNYKIIPLQSYFLFNDINEEDKKNKKFEILFLELEDISDKSCMFYDCNKLIEFGNYEINKNEIKDNVIEEENNLNSEDTGKYKDFYPNDIVEDKINKNISNSLKETLKFFKLKLNKVNKVKRNHSAYLKNISSMFCGCTSLISLPDISIWNINNVNNINHIFSGCSSLISLPDISKWNTNNVKKMYAMFSGCLSLLLLPDIFIIK